MPLPKYAPVPQPPNLALLQTDEDRELGREILFPTVPEGAEGRLIPMVEAHSFEKSAVTAFRCDAHLIEVLDCIGATYKMTRAETIRRLLYAVVTDFPGDFEDVSELTPENGYFTFIEEESDQERKVAEPPPGGEPKPLRSVPHAKQKDAA
jgi:hypothetical protein